MTIENSFKIEIINKIHKSLSTLLYIIYIYIYIYIYIFRLRPKSIKRNAVSLNNENAL